MTDNVDDAKGFYGEVFNWRFEEKDMGPMGTYVMAHRGEHQTAGIMKKPAEVPAPPHWLTYVFVEDIEATVAKVKGLGGKVMMPPTAVPGVGRTSIITDNQGAAIGLFGDPEMPDS